MSSIQELIREIKQLQPVPAIISQILDIVDSPDSSVAEIAQIIQYDPVITASVLRTCNSAYFGLKNPAESIKDAVALLGTDQIVEVVLMKSCGTALSGDQKGYGQVEGDMWKYSVSSAVIAKQIAEKLEIEKKNTIFTSALLKDIGKIVLDKSVSESSDKIFNTMQAKSLSFLEAEKAVLGIDHTELGGMIGKMWKFSPKMVKMIRNHHLSDKSMLKDMEVAVVYLADCISMMLGIGVGSDGLAYRFNEQVMQELGMEADDISKIMLDFASEIKKVEDLLHIV